MRTEFRCKIFREKDHLVDLGVDVKIKLKLNL
jgi:hypothetical protein